MCSALQAGNWSAPLVRTKGIPFRIQCHGSIGFKYIELQWIVYFNERHAESSKVLLRSLELNAEPSVLHHIASVAICRSPTLRHSVDEAGIKVRFTGDMFSDPRQHTSGDSDVNRLSLLQQDIAAREVCSAPDGPRDSHWPNSRYGELCGIVWLLDGIVEFFHVARKYGGR